MFAQISKKAVFLFVAAGFAASTASAAPITLIDEDFNSPQDSSSNDTNLVGNTTAFPDWNFNDGSGLQPGYRVGPNDGVPVSAGDGYIKMDSYGSGYGFTVQYDTGHNWSANDVFTLSLNATEQSWNSASDRSMIVSIRETSRSGNQLNGDTLWTVTEALVLDPDHDSSGEGWGANNTFSWTFNATDFATGTEGTAISFEIRGEPGTSRGFYFDNVLLTVVPEPGTFVTADRRAAGHRWPASTEIVGRKWPLAPGT